MKNKEKEKEKEREREKEKKRKRERAQLDNWDLRSRIKSHIRFNRRDVEDYHHTKSGKSLQGISR